MEGLDDTPLLPKSAVGQHDQATSQTFGKILTKLVRLNSSKPLAQEFHNSELDTLAESDLNATRRIAAAAPASMDRIPQKAGITQNMPQQTAVLGSSSGNQVAILGMACRFPAGCDSPEVFWDFITKGGNGMTPTPLQRWNVHKFTNRVPKTPTEKVQYIMGKGSYIHGVELFDGGVFGINPAEARHMDPQQRLLMDVVHEAIHDAGLTASDMENTRTCVFVGVMNQDTRSLQEVDGYTVNEASSSYKTSGGALSMCAGRISHNYGLLGAASIMDTACSSSLVALHYAVKAIQNNEADMAIVAGVNLLMSPFTTSSAAQMGLLSPDVACKTFDESANGYARGEGCGAIILKRLADAERDQDRVLAIVRATAVMHDGRSTSLVAPNSVAQERLLRYTLSQAGLKGGDIAYMECHGTGTKLGDAMEMTAVGAVMGEERVKPLVLGAVKTNIGHLESAAGIAGLIKALMVLRKKEVPRNLHLKTLNPAVVEALGPLSVIMPESTIQLEAAKGSSILAGVSSFGFSGTIAHVVLEQPSDEAANRPRKVTRADARFNSKSIVWSSVKDDHEMIACDQKLPNGNMRFWVELNRRLARMFEGHQVFGRVVVPGSAFVEMAGAAACTVLSSGAVELINVTITAPLVLNWLENEDIEAQLPVLACTLDMVKGSFEISSYPRGEDGSKLTLHVKGTFKKVDPEKGVMDVPAAQKRCNLAMAPEVFNESFDKVGLAYTGPFDVIRDVAYSAEGEAICRLQVPSSTKDVLMFYNPPALLDASFRCIRAALAGKTGVHLADSGKALLPFAMGRVHFVRNDKIDERINMICGITHAFGHARITAVTPTSATATCTLMDSKGKTLVKVEGFLVREMAVERLQAKLQTLPGALYATHWQPAASLPPSEGMSGYILHQTLVLSLSQAGAAGALLADLEQCGCSVATHGQHGITLLDAEAVQQLLDGSAAGNVVLLAMLDGDEGSCEMEPMQAAHAVLLVLKAVQKANRPMVLTAVTCGTWRLGSETLSWGAVAASGAVGLIRSGRHEIHGCSLRLLDLDPVDVQNGEATSMLVAEMTLQQDPNLPFDGEVAYRNGQRFVPRMAREEVITATEIGQGVKFRGDPDGVYVITGGFGGVGICVAQQLADSGAGCIALVSRSGKVPHADQAGLLKRYLKLKASFVDLRVFACDVREPASLKHVLQQLRNTGKAIKGVLHAAGELSDATIAQQSWETMERAFAVRAHGALNLHHLTATDKLDFFVMISSVSGLIGNHGQANYAAANTFMDTLAQWRVSQGLPGMAIQLTGVSELGIAAANLTEAKLKRFHPVPPQVVSLGVSTAVMRHAKSVVLALMTDNPENLRDLFRRMRLNEPRISSMWEEPKATTSPANSATPAAPPAAAHPGSRSLPRASEPVAKAPPASAAAAQSAVSSSPAAAQTAVAVRSPHQYNVDDESSNGNGGAVVAVSAGGVSKRAAELEEMLVGVVVGVLGCNDDDELRTAQLTELGMDSLGATEIVNALNDELKLTLPVSFVFENPCIAQLAAALDDMLPKVEIEDVTDEPQAQPAPLPVVVAVAPLPVSTRVVDEETDRVPEVMAGPRSNRAALAASAAAAVAATAPAPAPTAYSVPALAAAAATPSSPPVSTPRGGNTPFTLPHAGAVSGRVSRNSSGRTSRNGSGALDSPVPAPAKVCFLFTGQSSQYKGMCKELFERNTTFRSVMLECDEIVNSIMGWSLLKVVYDEAVAPEMINETGYAQPAIFCVEMALARTWLAAGVKPDVVCGHSLGEYAAACMAGAISMHEAVLLVCTRGALMQKLDAADGIMVALPVSYEVAMEAISTLPHASQSKVGVAAVNAPKRVVLSGSKAAVEAAVGKLGVKGSTLRTSHAFHSPLMAPMLSSFRLLLSKVLVKRLAVPMVSTVTGEVTVDLPHQYWLDQIVRPVAFHAAMAKLSDLGCNVFIEIGPRISLIKLGQQSLGNLPNASHLVWQPSVDPDKPAGATLAAAIRTIQQRVGITPDSDTASTHNDSLVRSVANMLPDFRLPSMRITAVPSASDLASAGTAGNPPQPAGQVPSHQQLQMLMLSQLYPSTPAYNLPFVFRINGRELPNSAFDKALDTLCHRHSVLRSVFVISENAPSPHIVLKDYASSGIHVRHMERVELEASPPQLSPEAQHARFKYDFDREYEQLPAAVVALLKAEAMKPFDLLVGPLVRCVHVRVSPVDHVVLMNMHHSVSDGWSMGVACREVAMALGAELAGGDAPAGMQYMDMLAEQQSAAKSGALAAGLKFWKEHLQGVPPVLDLPLDHPRPARPRLMGRYVDIDLGGKRTSELRAFAAQHKVTPYMVLLATYSATLARYAGTEKVVIGSPFHGRRRRELQNSIGCFMNVLPLPLEVPRDTAFSALLLSVRDELMRAFKYADVPFPQLVQELGLTGRHAHNPLFQAMFVMQDQGTQQEVEGGIRAGYGLDVSSCEMHLGTSHFDLTLELLQRGSAVVGMLEYNCDVLDHETVQRMADHMVHMLDSAIKGAETPVGALQLMGQQQELYDTVQAFNSTFAVGPTNMCLHQLVQQQAAQAPGAIALMCGQASMTYSDLMAASEKVTATLLQRGLRREERVGVLLPRALDLPVAILGVLAAGGAYVPIDPGYPRTRIEHVLADSGCRFVITAPEVAHAAGSGSQLLFVKDLMSEAGTGILRGAVGAAAPSPTSLAYVIYTSGSTGKPKGVMIEHRSIVNHVYHWIRAIGSRAGDVVPAVSAIGFDASVKQMFVPLCSGATLKLVSPKELLEAQLGSDVTLIVDVTPSALSLLSPKAFPKLKSVSLGGEHVPLKLVQQWAPHVRVLNEYGPTEAAVACMIAELTADMPKVLVGRPLPNYQIYILDERMKPVPRGARGELYIGGDGVALGYLNRDDLTAERFLPNPFCPGRIYRTGDMARMQSDGEVELLGRLDRQVKLRGYRIELGEVETAMCRAPGVEQAVASLITLPSGQQQLVAWVAPRGVNVPVLRQLLSSSLPEFMVPSEVMCVERMPLTAHGKVDMDALELPAYAAGAPGASKDAGSSRAAPPPTQEVQELMNRVRQLWAEVLQVDASMLTASTNFFQVGGNSLLAIKVMTHLRQSLGAGLPIELIFENPTLEQLAQALGGSNSTLPASERSESNGMMAMLLPSSLPPQLPSVSRMQAADHPWPLSMQQEQLLFLHQLNPASVAYNVPILMQCHGPLNVGDLRTALYQLVKRHPTLRSTFGYVAGKPAQMAVERGPHELRLRFEDLTSSPLPPVTSLEERTMQLLDEEFSKPFDLARGQVLRVLVVRTEPHSHVLMICAHHIVMDGPSAKVLLKELSALYNHCRRGLPGDSAPLEPLRVLYSDYAVWQNSWLDSEAATKQVAFWKKTLQGLPAALNLPTDHPRPARPSGRGAGLSFSIDASAACGLEQLSRTTGCSLQSVMLAALGVVLARYSNESDFAIALPYAGRTHPDIEPLVGYFVNSLPIPIHLDHNSDFATLVAAVQRSLVSAIANADVPFTRVVQSLETGSAQGFNPVFQTMLVLQQESEMGAEQALAGGGTLQPLNLAQFGKFTRTAKLDLTLYLTQSKAGLEGWMEYSTDLFKEVTVKRLLDALRLLLTTVTDPEHKPATKLSDLPLLNASEEHSIVCEYNSTQAYFPSNVPLHQLFEEQARKTPDAVAVLQELSSPLTYGQLNSRAHHLALHILSSGVRPGSKIAIFLPRCIDFYVAVLAVLKAGFAYVPIDSGYPRDRVFHILQDADCPLVLSNSKEIPALPPVSGTRPVPLDKLMLPLDTPASGTLPTVLPTSLAYIIYTSGSTGKPKGVMIEHRSIVNHIYHWARIIGCGAGDVVPAVSAVGFDASVKQMFVPLCSGATLKVISPTKLLDGQLGSEVTLIVDITPSALTLLTPKAFPKLRSVSLGGEQVPLKLVQQWAPHVRVLNEYGPTEAAVACMIAELTAEMQHVLVGNPLPNYQIYLLDERMKPVPRGALGELYIGGEGVARGYLNRDELSAQRFVPSPFGHGRLYRSGDVGRMHPDSQIELLGRLDRQVKLRGYRIEPGEIETALARCTGVTAAFVQLHGQDPSHQCLVAYVTPEHVEPAALLKELELSLPRFMVPATIVPLARLPMDPHGKLDVRALPPPPAFTGAPKDHPLSTPEPSKHTMASVAASLMQVEPEEQKPRVAVAALEARDDHKLEVRDATLVHPLAIGVPANLTPAELNELPLHPEAVAGMRHLVAGLWQQVLPAGSPQELQDDANFFEIGGHSLLAGQLASLLRDATDAPVSIVALFDHPTLMGQARYLTALVSGGSSDAVSVTTTDSMSGLKKQADAGRWPGTMNEPLLTGEGSRGGAMEGPVLEPLPSLLLNLLQLMVVLISKALPAAAVGVPFIAATYLLPLDSLPWLVASLIQTLAGAAVYIALLPGVVLTFKWTLLGVQTEGRRPLWRWYYVRWWAAKVLSKGMQATLVPLLLETEMYNWLLRALGARIGQSVIIDTADIADHDLISIGDHTIIEYGVSIHASTLQAGASKAENGTVTAAAIDIGSEAVIGCRACVCGGAVISDRGYVPPTSVLGGSHPSQQRHNDSTLPGRPKSMRLGMFGELNALVVLLVIHAMALWPMMLLLRAFLMPPSDKAIDKDFCKPFSLKWLAFAWMQVVLVPAVYWMLVLLYKCLVMGRFTEDSHQHLQSSGWWRFRYHVHKRLLDSPLFALGHFVFGRTKLHNIWLRAMGARIGQGVMLFNALLREPDLVSIGDDVFVGGACVMVCVSPNTSQRISLGTNSMVGDTVTLLPGVVVEEFAVLGDHTFAHAGQRFNAFSHTVGSTCLRPGFSRDDVEGGVGGAAGAARAEQLRTQATATASRSMAGMLLYDISYFIASLALAPTPLTVMVLPVVAGYVLGKCVGDLPTSTNLALIPATLLVGVVLLVLWLALLKRLLRSSFTGRHALYSYHTWAWRLLMTVVGTSWWLLYDLYGTHFQAWKLRLLGARVGKRVCMLSGENVEYDLLDIGTGAVLSEGCQLSGHVVRIDAGQGALLEHLPCRVGPGAMLGQRSTLLAGTSMQDGSQLLPNSVAMHGEVIRAGTAWAGVPAVPQKAVHGMHA